MGAGEGRYKKNRGRNSGTVQERIGKGQREVRDMGAEGSYLRNRGRNTRRVQVRVGEEQGR